MALHIRSCNQQDFAYIIPLLSQLWPDKQLNQEKLYEVFLKSIESPFDVLFCAEADGKVVAFCAVTLLKNFWQEGYIAYLSTMVVDDKYRGRGIGELLVTRVCEYAISKGCASIELDSAFHRVEAHKFYENLGFKKRAYTFSREL